MRRPFFIGMWTDTTEEDVIWSEIGDELATLTLGSPVGLLLTLTNAYTQTVRLTLWTDSSDSEAVWS